MSMLEDLLHEIVDHVLKECGDSHLYCRHCPNSLAKFVFCKCGKKWEIPFVSIIQAEKEAFKFSHFECGIEILNSKEYKTSVIEKRKQEARMEIARSAIRSLEV